MRRCTESVGGGPRVTSAGRTNRKAAPAHISQSWIEARIFAGPAFAGGALQRTAALAAKPGVGTAGVRLISQFREARHDQAIYRERGTDPACVPLNVNEVLQLGP